MDFYCDHVDGWSATVAWVRYAVAADGESCAIGIRLFRSIVNAYPAVGDISSSVYWDVISFDENDGVGAWALARDALGEAS